jgi:CysZ protein
MLRDPRVRGALFWAVGLAIATLVLLFVGVEALVSWASDTGYRWLDYTFQALGAFGTVIVAWFLFPSIVVAVSGIFLDRVVDATEDRLYPGLPPPRQIPLTEALLSSVRLLAFGIALNLLALPLYFLPLLNLPIWLALNGYLVGREYAELVASRRFVPALATRLRRDHRLAFWLSGGVIAAMLAIPILNLFAPVIGAAFMTQRYQRYCGDATIALRDKA